MRLLMLGLIALAVTAQAGEIYRWVDEKGKVHYGDQPTAQSKKSTRVTGKPNVVDVDKESYPARRAREEAPVTLYATECGPVCDQAKDYLKQRGVPYSLKDPAKTPEIAVELKKLTGGLEIPVVVVGKNHQKGFEADVWDKMLVTAGYPLKPQPEKP